MIGSCGGVLNVSKGKGIRNERSLVRVVGTSYYIITMVFSFKKMAIFIQNIDIFKITSVFVHFKPISL